ncbi:MAG TPA: transcriptional regulator [Erysipelotrichaceae bacterium]|nr:transcriptional regulator [Erysipelotrichaceae bacterium]
MSGFYEELGERLRMERLRKRKSLQDVADQVKVSKNTVLNWENGKHKIDMISLIKVCRYLEIDVKSLLDGTIDSTVI